MGGAFKVSSGTARAGLASGQITAIGADGNWQARSGAGAMSGKHPLKRVIHERAERPAAEIVRLALEAIEPFLLPLGIQDDARLMVVKVER